MGLVLMMVMVLGCSANEYAFDEYPFDGVLFGGSATTVDVCNIHENWDAIKSGIIAFSGLSCGTDVGLEDLQEISIESMERVLPMPAIGFDPNIDPKDVRKVYALAFRDPCGATEEPQYWFVADTVDGFLVFDFVLIEDHHWQ